MNGDAPGETSRRRVLVTGASGPIGAALFAELSSNGWQVMALRRGAGPGPRWDPARGEIGAHVFDGVSAVVHLAGESIAGRFTARRKAAILSSRRDGTTLLAEAIARSPDPPRTLVSASAVGIYGDRGDETLDESSATGSGFLADVARIWEGATEPAARAGARVVIMRFGLVMTRAGGALPPMLLPARLGLGGPLGSGRQWWSWIAMSDLARAIRFALEREVLRGPVNATAPEPVRQREFARVLGRVLGRPAVLPAPAFALRLLLGREMADSLLLSSARVRPARLLAAGFEFQYPALEPALRAVLA
jgi:hypothetical protein